MDIEGILAILSRLVAFDTVSRNSNLPLIDWIDDYLRPLGFTLERLPDPTGRKANLLATVGPAGRAGYVLSGHTDVVPVDGQAWTSDPFTLRREGERLYGRGACDMKGFLAVCLAAAPRMAEARLKKPIHLAFSYDEEVGCIGVRSLLDRLAGAEVKPQACFVGEPTGMEVVIGHKGKRSVRATVVGQTCHSSLAPQGVNAVEFGAMLAAEISRIGERLIRDGARDALYDVPHSTGHVGVLRGGMALNIVPDLCEIMFEFRVIGGEDADRLVDEVVAFARERLEPRMRAVNAACGIEFDVFAGFPGLDTPPDDAVVTLATSLTGGNRHGKVAFGTEAGLFRQVAGIPTAILGPGSIEQAHKADEWIGIEQLERCATFVDRLTDHASK